MNKSADSLSRSIGSEIRRAARRLKLRVSKPGVDGRYTTWRVYRPGGMDPFGVTLDRDDLVIRVHTVNISPSRTFATSRYLGEAGFGVEDWLAEAFEVVPSENRRCWTAYELGRLLSRLSWAMMDPIERSASRCGDYETTIGRYGKRVAIRRREPEHGLLGEVVAEVVVAFEVVGPDGQRVSIPNTDTEEMADELLDAFAKLLV